MVHKQYNCQDRIFKTCRVCRCCHCLHYRYVNIDFLDFLFGCLISCLTVKGAAGQQIVIQQPQQAQILQTSDGQTLIYQPVPLDQQGNLSQQTQPTCKNLLILRIQSLGLIIFNFASSSFQYWWKFGSV